MATEMFATTASVSAVNVLEYFENMWVELILASLSAVVYFMFSRKRAQKKSTKASGSDAMTWDTSGVHYPRWMEERVFNADIKAQHKKSSGTSSAAMSTTACSETSGSMPNSPRSSTGDDNTACKDASVRNSGINKKVAMRANDIRSCGRNGNLNGAIKVFERLGNEGECTLVVNSLLDACVECQALEKAIFYFDRARCLGLADVVSYNKMMKGYLAKGQEGAARRLLVELISKGMANTTSYHGLLNARVNAGDLRGGWKIIAEMQGNGIPPNAVTCAILLKGRLQSVEEVSRVLALVDAMEEPMDEVLFMAVAEACVRVDRLDVLSRQMEKFKHQGGSGALSPETYGSMIKAYGKARDTKRVWDLWNQMMKDRAQLTSVTLGCMVEALVANGHSVQAWELVQDLLNDESSKLLVNTVICSSILKGFAYAKDPEKVMGLYKQMQAYKIQPNTITFNTMLNAFAQCGTMQYAPELLEDMKKASVKPDIVTYSTLVKGYCCAGCLDRALEVFRDMQKDGTRAPDEVLFNSLLGGCAKEFRLDEALHLLNEMKKYGIAPSNYTLSMLVKLMCRCRRLDQAFKTLEDISKEYNFKINIQVYTCLIQGCFHERQTDKALAVYDTILKERLQPDAMTFTVLVRGCLRAGNVDKAAELVRNAHGIGLKTSHKKNAAPGIHAGILDEVVATLGGAASKDGAQLLSDLREWAPATAPSDHLPGLWQKR